MIRGIDHIAIAVRSIDDSLAYYTEELKLPLVHDELLPSAGVRLAYVQAGPIMIQLVQPIGETPIRKFLEEKGEGLHHLCFEVQDIPETLTQLVGESETRVVMGGRDRRAAFLSAHSNGLILELTETDPVRGG
ncbi:methylmalonyl-CoA epimerase [Paenibacillus taihuensis]|uniref:Methylmalonyl-CoA epimerase n=1 Tax=Paenibacillus taihuensis TaxID=1156355 RepID=A0A3D9S182_9BACL|nr:VOC family protein [Paenibacillus taihuensis]REE86203.1 methylmalonyl-CoA epimerase [Paenibacillus taihuensis]